MPADCLKNRPCLVDAAERPFRKLKPDAQLLLVNFGALDARETE